MSTEQEVRESASDSGSGGDRPTGQGRSPKAAPAAKPRATHFVSLRITNPALCERAREVCEQLRSGFPGLGKAFVPLDKLHISLAVVAAEPDQLQLLVQIFKEQCACLPPHAISHSSVGTFRRDVVFMGVDAAPQLTAFCVRLHEALLKHAIYVVSELPPRLHMTLLKSSRLRKRKEDSEFKQAMRAAVQQVDAFKLASPLQQSVTQLQLCSMNTAADGYYTVEATVDCSAAAPELPAPLPPAPYDQLPTPAFLVRLPVVARNCSRMAQRAAAAGVALRPHVKTHKTLHIAALQLQAPSVKGIVVSTLAEAEFFSAGGHIDITFGSPVIPWHFQRCLALFQAGCNLSVFIDDATTLHQLQLFAAAHHWRVPVLVKIDAGNKRAGVPDADALHLVSAVFELGKRQGGGVELMGVYSHSGHAYSCTCVAQSQACAAEECSRMSELCKRLEAAGITVPVVSVGSTPTASVAVNMRGAGGGWDVHPGNYVFYDRQQVNCGACSPHDIAATVLARIVGVYPHNNHFLIDAGALALSKDLAPPHAGYGGIRGHAALEVIKVTQELGKVSSADGSPVDFSRFCVGALVEVVPNHSCLTAACFPQYVCLGEGDAVERVISPCKFW